MPCSRFAVGIPAAAGSARMCCDELQRRWRSHRNQHRALLPCPCLTLPLPQIICLHCQTYTRVAKEDTTLSPKAVAHHLETLKMHECNFTLCSSVLPQLSLVSTGLDLSISRPTLRLPFAAIRPRFNLRSAAAGRLLQCCNSDD